MSSKLPTAVPLPEVGEYTQDVVFGNLGLPVGFDEERLQVNLRAIDRVRAVAGLATVSVVGVAGETTETDYGVSGFNNDGSAIFAGVMKRRKKPLSHANVTFPTPTSLYGKPDVLIEVNNAETTERIHESGDRFDRGQFDPRPRAKYLNTAVRNGLIEASRGANMDKYKLLLFLPIGWALTQMWLDSMAHPQMIDSNAENAAMVIAAGSLALTFASAIGIRASLPDVSGHSFWNILKNTRKSIVPSLAVDRALGAHVIARTSKIIKAQA